MNLIKFVIASSLILLAIGLIGEKSVYGEHINALLAEDQAIICLLNTNEESKYFGTESCKYVDILDLLTEKQESKLNDLFGENYDIDTFPFGVITK